MFEKINRVTEKLIKLDGRNVELPLEESDILWDDGVNLGAQNDCFQLQIPKEPSFFSYSAPRVIVSGVHSSVPEEHDDVDDTTGVSVQSPPPTDSGHTDHDGNAFAIKDDTKFGFKSELDATIYSLYGDVLKTGSSYLTVEQLVNGLDDMLSSKNSEIKGIAAEISTLLEYFGFNIEDIENILNSNSNSNNSTDSIGDKEKLLLILNELFNALGAENNSFGLNSSCFLALDKNGNGSIVDDLKNLLTDSALLADIQKKIDAANNKAKFEYALNELIDKNNNGYLNVGEIAAMFSKSEIARLFKSPDGTVDRALIIALGGQYSADGNYSISIDKLNRNIWQIDTDGDGNITQEEIDAFKQTDAYKKAQYDIMLKELDKKDGLSTITGIKDNKLLIYMLQIIGNGYTVDVERFTENIDIDGDGIVTNEELQKFVDFVTQFYSVDKNSRSDKKITKKEAMQIEPFKSNPDLWYAVEKDNGCFPNNDVTVSLLDVWNLVKSQ